MRIDGVYISIQNFEEKKSILFVGIFDFYILVFDFCLMFVGIGMETVCVLGQNDIWKTCGIEGSSYIRMQLIQMTIDNAHRISMIRSPVSFRFIAT